MSSLGKWESRAVAFVFGCGIGVLVRIAMLFVILSARSYRRAAAMRRACLAQPTTVPAVQPVVVYTEEKVPILAEVPPAYPVDKKDSEHNAA